MELPSNDEFAKGVRPILNRITEHTWEEDTGTTLGGAGLSVALVLVLTQLSSSTVALRISMFCAAVAVPVWTTLWQIGAAYSFYTVRPVAAFSLRNPLFLGALLFAAGGLLLLISFATPIWHFSVLSSVAFIVASAGGIVFISRHHAAVRRQAECDSE